MLDGEECSPQAEESFTCLNSLHNTRKKKNKNKRRFSDEQIRSLESIFESESKLEPRKKLKVARDLGLQPRQVAIWFQNKRARWKSKQLEQDYSILQADYNSLATRFEALKKEKQALSIQLQELNELMQKPQEESRCCRQGVVEGDCIDGESVTNSKGKSEVKPSLSLERTAHDGVGVLSDDDSSIKVEYFGMEEEEPNLLNLVEPADGSLTSTEDWGSFAAHETKEDTQIKCDRKSKTHSMIFNRNPNATNSSPIYALLRAAARSSVKVKTERERVMNDLSNTPIRDGHCYSFKPIPPLALCSPFSYSFVVHNAFFFVPLLSLSALVIAFIVWNALNYRTNGAVLLLLHSFPDSDLRLARHGQLVKITGPVSCGSLSLESSYENVSRCIYTSTLLYEYGGFGLKLSNVNKPCFRWSLVYSERFSTDFYITDKKSGIRAMVKAGSDCKVIPLIVESRLVNTTGRCRILSSHFTKWLRDRNLSAESRLLRLEEGYIKEGSSVTVIGMLHRNNDIVMIVQPPELISTGCLWRKLLLPVDVDGLILGVPELAAPMTNTNSVRHPEQ
ncbi:hypothetical protein L1049_014182 [Liquidambar formosana]|uniref:Homeobox domain-containing protein n=1 Tax=Liquidambar formosana TaxID=63359 RepID=A0AAP0RQJ9_LIQFO